MKVLTGNETKVVIAQAIMEDPDIVILDEPMNGLDDEGVSIIRKLISELKMKKKTVLLASHNKVDIELLCDLVFRMNKGTLSVT